MQHTARGRYETSLDDPDFTFDPAVGRSAALYLGDGPDDPAVFPLEVGADYRFPVHFHATHYMSLIIRGSLRVGRRWYYPGDIRMQEQGSVYGPEEAGPDGCYMLNIFKDRRGATPSMLGAEDAEPIEIPPFIQLSKVWDQRRPDGGDLDGADGDTAQVAAVESEHVAVESPDPAARRF